MTRITLHLAMATALTAPHLRALGPSAAAKLAGQAIGVTLLMALLVIGAFVATVASAARGLAAMLAEFVRLATAMLSATVLMLIVILVTVALLIHHLPAHGRRAAGSRFRDRRRTVTCTQGARSARPRSSGSGL
jgi:hypothetical protein